MFVLALLTWGSADAATLDEALRAAEEQSIDLKLVAENTRATESVRGQAWSQLSPVVQAQGGYFVNSQEIALDPKDMIPPAFQAAAGETTPIIIQPKNYWQGTVTIQQPLFSGSALPVLMSTYKAASAAQYDAVSQRSQIRSGVAHAYYGLLTARQGVELAIAAEATTKSGLELAKRQVDAGTAPPRAILQAELALSRATRDVESAKEGVVAAEEGFHRLTGLPRDTELVLPEAPIAAASLEDAIAQAKTSRPDLAAAEMRRKAADLQVRANWLGWMPKVNARYTWIYSENSGFAGDKTMWVAAVEGEWLLWDGGYRTAKAAEYGARARQAALMVDSAAIDAESDVRTAWERYHRAEAALVAVEREQKLATENLDLAKRGFEAGTTTWLEVEQADLGQRAAQLNGLVERMNRDLAAIDLQVATGTW